MNVKQLIETIKRSDWLTILILGALQGLLSTISLEPFNFPLTAWLAPWPLFYFARRFRNQTKFLLISGAVSSLFLCIFAFYWMFYLFQEFAGLNFILSLLVFVPYTILLNLKSPLFVLLLGISYKKRFRTSLPSRYFTVGILSLLTDFSTPQIFPWYWGNLLAGNNWFAQIAEATGIYGLSFILFSGSFHFYRLSGSLYLSLLSNNKGSTKTFTRIFTHIFRKKIAYLTPALILLSLFAGGFRKYQMEKFQAELPTVRVAAIQPNTPLDRPGDFRLTQDIFRKLLIETIPGLAKKGSEGSDNRIDLLVLPESAVPYFSTDDTPYNRKNNLYSTDFELMIQLLAYNLNTDVFFNEITIQKGKDLLNKETGLVYNSSVVYSRDGKRRDSYHKNELLAFGEYIPGLEFLNKTGLIHLVPGIVRGARFYPGKKYNLLPYTSQTRNNDPVSNSSQLSQANMIGKNPRDFEKEFPAREYTVHGQFMSLICYEILFPEHTRRFFNKGQNPDFMASITQDGWYGNTSETHQHFELGRIRSIETRRALIRSTNSGSSGFIDIAGNYVKPLLGPKKTEYDTEDVQVWDVPINRSEPTIYVRYGNAWIYILSGIYLMFCFSIITRKKLLFQKENVPARKLKGEKR